jgi:subtilisin family serine protease
MRRFPTTASHDAPRRTRTAATQALFGATLVTAALLAASPAPAVAPDPASLGPIASEEFAPAQILIQLAPESYLSLDYRPALARDGRTGLAALDASLAAIGATAIEPVFDLGVNAIEKSAVGLDRIFLVRYSSGISPLEAARLFAGSQDLVYAEPNGIVRALLTPNDPTFPLQWAHNNTGQAVRFGGGTVGTPDCDTDSPEAWDLQTGSPSLILSIVDTGIDAGHPEFAGRVLPGFDFVNNDANPNDDNGHGTSCSGIALGAGNNGQGIAGVAWGVQVLPVKVLNSQGSGTFTQVANGVIWAADNGARVLSLSLGGGANSTMQNAVNYAVNTIGCAMFAATGNGNSPSLSYPAAYPNVISVGALSPCNERKNPGSCDGETWWGSNYGTGIDFLAPGTRIHTTDIRGAGGYNAGDYTPDFNGTSSATPHAAGIGALVWSQNPSLTNTELLTILQNNCDDIGAVGFDTQTGYGRMNAFRSVQAAGGGAVPVTVFEETYEVNTVPGTMWNSGDNNPTNGYDFWGHQTAASGARVHNGSRSAYCAGNSDRPGQIYDLNCNTNLTLRTPLNVAGFSSLSLSFWKWHNLHDSDYLAFEIWNGSAWVEQQRWTAVDMNWTQYTYSLAGYSSLRFRFIFFSNPFGRGEGAYIDDIVVSGIPTAAGQPPISEGVPTATLVRVVTDEDPVAKHDVAAAIDAASPAAPALSIAPNPSRGESALRFALPASAAVTLDLYTVDGRRVSTLVDGRLQAGDHSVRWDGRDASGEPVAAGVYFARLAVDGRASAIERVVLVR